MNTFASHCKFADDTTVIGLITDNDETAHREEVRELAMWCQDNNLSLNVSKIKEIVDLRKRRAEQAPININIKFLGVHIINELSWSKHIKRAQNKRFPLRRLKRFASQNYIYI